MNEQPPPPSVRGSWWFGRCGCGHQLMFRTRSHRNDRGTYCKDCGHYTMVWRWIRIGDAVVTDGGRPPPVTGDKGGA